MKQYPVRRATAPTLHLLASPDGSGTSDLARELERSHPAVRFTLDEWMQQLYRLPDDDPGYREFADRCTALIWDTAGQVLGAGTDAVLDWNLWSRSERTAWRDRARIAGFRAVVHLLPGRAGRSDPRFEEPCADEELEIRIVSPERKLPSSLD
ncbi:putative kinase [Microlunatus parietis]|uniref:Putative kinase n=2 Tax=Microlunatus parietis TaxID=682979 RepID=A0A7Y9LCP0_9ACTN|nr:putative kinase [Microlunatus parietis]